MVVASATFVILVVPVVMLNKKVGMEVDGFYNSL